MCSHRVDQRRVNAKACRSHRGPHARSRTIAHLVDSTLACEAQRTLSLLNGIGPVDGTYQRHGAARASRKRITDDRREHQGVSGFVDRLLAEPLILDDSSDHLSRDLAGDSCVDRIDAAGHALWSSSPEIAPAHALDHLCLDRAGLALDGLSLVDGHAEHAGTHRAAVRKAKLPLDGCGIAVARGVSLPVQRPKRDEVDAKQYQPVQWRSFKSIQCLRAVHVLAGQAQQDMRQSRQGQALED